MVQNNITQATSIQILNLHKIIKSAIQHSLLNWQSVWTRDGVSVEEGEEVLERVEEGPVRKKADAFVGVDGHRSIRPEPVTQKTQLRPLLVSQMFLWVGLIKLNGSSINLPLENIPINHLREMQVYVYTIFVHFKCITIAFKSAFYTSARERDSTDLFFLSVREHQIKTQTSAQRGFL